MPVDLNALLDPRHTALVTSEFQKGVVGPLTSLPALADSVREGGVAAKLGGLARAARKAGVPVLHAVIHSRADGGGKFYNCVLTAAGRKRTTDRQANAPASQLMDELEQADSDYVLSRYHGVSIFHDSELDAILRSLGVRTVVLTGVSVNVALLGSTIEAVNRGYQVVMPRDGVAGVPPEYAAQVMDNTLRLLATLTTCETISEAWRAQRAAA
jgi:nicotinamidase-related amidase